MVNEEKTKGALSFSVVDGQSMDMEIQHRRKIGKEEREEATQYSHCDVQWFNKLNMMVTIDVHFDFIASRNVVGVVITKELKMRQITVD